MPTCFQDVTQALRALRGRPGFTFAAVLTLAVGIGANVTVFSLVNALLLRPLPFGDRSDRVVTIHATQQQRPEDWGWGDSELSYRDLLDLRAAGALEAVGGYFPRNFTVSGEDAAERIQGGSVTPDLLPLLGVEPILGRHFLPEEAAPPGLESSVLLTHGLWQRRYGSDASIIGRTIVVNERARTVVGVLPPGFRFPERDELYLPLRWDEAPRSTRNVNAVGLLKRGATLQQAQSELTAIAERLAHTYPDTNRGYGVRILRFRDSQVGADERTLTTMLMSAVGFVLLIACANLANLLLVRGAARQREMAVRAAIGASRWRLVSGMLAESAALAVAGSIAGTLGAVWVIDLVQTSWPEDLPYWVRLDVDLRIVLFAVGVTAVTAIAIGLLPALRASRPDVVGDLKEGSRGTSLGRGAQRLQAGLVVAQVALCLALLVSANLMIRSFLALQSADIGFDHRPLLTMRAYLAGDAYDDVRARAAFFQRSIDTLRTLPGVAAAAATTSIPGDDGGGAVRVVIDGQASREDDVPASAIATVGALFDVFGIPLLEGRTFTGNESADPDAGVLVINQALGARLWPGQSAVDRRIGLRTDQGVNWFRVIGVAPNVHYEEVGESTDVSRLNVYVPYAQSGSRTMALLVRSQAAPATLIMPVRDAMRGLHAGLPLFDVMPMSERRRVTTFEQRFFGQMMGAFAGAATLMACLGVYALLAYAARRRMQEIGVRLALGAAPRDVIGLFVWQGSRLAAVGLAAGLALSITMARALSGTVFAVDAFDPSLFAAMSGLLFAVVLASTYLPARRASRIDPMIALRIE